MPYRWWRLFFFGATVLIVIACIVALAAVLTRLTR
jgi:hypothetical protein